MSREEARDKAFIKFRDEVLGGVQGAWDGWDRVQFDVAFELGRTAGRSWTRVESADDWPEDGGEYEVTVEDLVNYNGPYVEFMGFAVGIGFEINPEMGKVTAWRNKSEPYTEGGNETNE